MSNHAALIAKLEAATEGSRAMSEDCLIAVGWQRQNEYWGEPRDKPGQVHYWRKDTRPSPAESLDDAVRWMVDEEWQWTIRRTPGLCSHATVWDQSSGRSCEARGATPALAFCAAALCLKARAGE